MKKQGNFFTGKGAISIEESISDVSELGGDYFSDDELMKEYIESQIGWSEGDYGIMNISVEADPQMMTLGSEYYRGDGGILCRAPRGGGGVTELGGLTKTVNAGIFRSPRVSIYMSPHQSLIGSYLKHDLIGMRRQSALLLHETQNPKKKRILKYDDMHELIHG